MAKISGTWFCFSLLAGTSFAYPYDSKDIVPKAVTSLDLRALPDSPSGNYAPMVVDCPSNRPEIRLAEKLSEQEASWLKSRRSNTVEPLQSLLERAKIPNFDAKGYINSISHNTTALPNIGIALSGGGYRALMNGAGFLSAADLRNDANGPISGLLQASTYVAGLSGGSWLLGSVFANNFSTIPDLQRGDKDSALWRFDRSIFKGPKESGIGALNTVGYWKDIVEQVGEKGLGWDTSITDFWGRALSYQLVNAPDGGLSYTFSSIADTQDFKDAKTPFPLIVADGRAPNEHVISINATVYEFNPYEFGSWDPTTYGFAPTRYLASNFTNGVVPKEGKCVRGFDQIGFVMGTSSSLFNQFLLRNVTAVGEDVGLPDFLVEAVEKILKELSEDENDIAQYAPNPFFGWNPSSNNANTKQSQLTLVDGGEDGQNLPLHPLIQPMRGLDIIFAVDSSADTDNNWPNGTALRATYDRVGTKIGNGTLFPAIPSAETFINERLNQRPTWFGCNADNFTDSKHDSVPPLIFYIPNAPYTTHSNVSTFDPAYPTEQRDAIIRNGFNAATQGNGTVDNEWPVCVACAVLSRSWWKAGQSAPDACSKCFQRYCWNGTVDEVHVQDYNPSYIIGADQSKDKDSGAWSRLHMGASWLAVSLTTALALAM